MAHGNHERDGNRRRIYSFIPLKFGLPLNTKSTLQHSTTHSATAYPRTPNPWQQQSSHCEMAGWWKRLSQ